MRETVSTITLPNELVFDQVLECLQQGKCAVIRVKGRSMQPFIREGERVLLKRFDIREICRGMVVLAKVEGQMVLHRLVGYNRETVCLAGDGNLVQRERVAYADVIATVVSLYRGEKEIRLNQWSKCLGQSWYLVRPYRRLVSKLLGVI